MRIQDLTITAGVAMVTMVGGLALFAPTGVDAGRGKTRTLRAEGVEMTLRTTRTTREPTAELTLVNTTGETVQVTPRIALLTEAPNSEFSRMVSPPRQRWSDEPLYVLEPNETKTVTIDPGRTVPRRSLAWFTLHAGKRHSDTPAFVARPERKPGKLAKRSKKSGTGKVAKSSKKKSGLDALAETTGIRPAKQARRSAKRSNNRRASNAAPVAQMAFLD